MLRYVVHASTRRILAEDYLRDYVNVPKFRTFCQACRVYGTNWACPPFDFDPLDTWRGYRWLHLIAFRLCFTKDQPRTGLDHDQMITDVLEMFRFEKRRSHRYLMRLRAAVPGSQALAAGECRLCPVCTRSYGLPCRLPDQMMHSIEALGGDVEATMRVIFDDPVAWSDGTSLPDHYTLVAGLLADQAELPEVPFEEATESSRDLRAPIIAGPYQNNQRP